MPRSMNYRAHARRRGIAGIVVAALLSALVVTPQAAAEPVASGQVSERARVTAMWLAGGPVMRAEAEKALVGSDEDVRTFFTTGMDRAVRIDARLSVNQLLASGGPTVKGAAQRALDDGSNTALAAFVDSGWRTPQRNDMRIRVNQILTAGGPEVRKAVQAVLDVGTTEALSGFLDTGWQIPYGHDLRIRVNQALAVGGPETRKVAQQALDSGTQAALQRFIDLDMPVAQIRDMETATVAELAAVAKAAGEQAAKDTQAAKQASELAVTEASLAREAAEKASRAAESAQGNAAEAAAAATLAADAANRAASAARDAVGAANAASSSAWIAANAASRAATAASMTEQAASSAYSAAAAAATDAGKASAAREAAQNARTVAAGAKDAADAAQAAGDAAREASSAATSAGNAGSQAAAAAQAAADAAGFADSAGADATIARNAAAAARTAAARANRAATASTDFATVAVNAADQAKTAARRAADDANTAADAADDAADHAGQSADAAKKATEYANSATAAAQVAIGAATQAKQIYDAARKADSERVAVQAEQADEAAWTAKAALVHTRPSLTWDMSQVARRDAETVQLIADATKPGVDPAVVLSLGRRIAVKLVALGGSWTRTAAVAALSGSDGEVREFVRTGIQVAAGQDDRVTLQSLMLTGTANLRKAGQSALAGSDADVLRFLQDRAYPERDTDDRIAVNQVLAAARTAGRGTVQQDAQKALDAGTGTAYREFLTKRQYVAAGIDDRIAANRILASATSGPETKGAAQAALDGPSGFLRQFLDVRRHEVAQRDQNSAAHDAEVSGYVSQAARAAAAAAQQANEAQATAATARGAAAEAADYAQRARDSANEATGHAQRAHDSAVQAERSALDAVNSARTASDAASAASASSRQATRSAVWAQASASQAAGFAQGAYDSATRAYNSAIGAGKDAEAANAAAAEATRIAIRKIDDDKVAAALQQGTLCENRFGKGTPRFDDCVHMLTASADDLVEMAFINGTTCEAISNNPQGTAAPSCLSDVLDPDFETMRVLEVVGALISVYSAIYFTVGVGTAALRLGFACVVSPICGGLMAAFDPAAAAFTPWLGLAGAGTTSAVVGVRTAGELEALTVRARAADARSIQSRLDDLGALLVRVNCARSFTASTPTLRADGDRRPMAGTGVGKEVVANHTAIGKSSACWKPSDEVLDRIFDDFGPYVAQGVEWNIARYNEGALSHALNGIGIDETALARYFQQMDARTFLYYDRNNPMSTAYFDASNDILVVKNAQMIHAYNYSKEDWKLNVGVRYLEL